ncbi:MAG: BrnT family toxin [Gammaproteobacteria bacterium]|nr:BrnT family toxin [Gammaproteobacteria bacterium]
MNWLRNVQSFEWDSGNARKSEKHGVSAREAEEVFANEPLVIVPDWKHSVSELRFHALGRTLVGRRLHVTFTLRAFGSKLRVISARDMHRKERRVYDRA